MADGSDSGRDQWADELHRQILQLRYKLRRRLFSGKSEYQRVDVVETEGFGRMLFNDGIAMLSERDEFVYHEMISHVPLFVHPGAERVLVIGGGDGGTVREVLRHPSVRHCRLIEIDDMVVEACREHLPVTAAALDDARVEVSIADGVRFVAETDQRYDLVIVDSTDPVGPAAPLFGTGFYRNVRRLLNDGGIVVSQAESPYFYEEQQRSLLQVLSSLFKRVNIYNYVTITYPGGLWSFAFATDADLCPVADLDIHRLERADLEFGYYSADIHRAAFVLPAFQGRHVRGLVTPLRGEGGGA